MNKEKKDQEVQANKPAEDYKTAQKEEFKIQTAVDPEKLFRWYVISTVHGKEDYVRRILFNKIIASDYAGKLKELIIIGEKVKRANTKETTTKSKYPGCLFINMIMDRDLWYLIRNTDCVSGFIGSSGKNSQPIPLTKREVNKILDQKKIYDASETSYVSLYKVGDLVEITSGLFKKTTGKIISKNDKEGNCKVEVEFFGKLIPAIIDYTSIKKL